MDMAQIAVGHFCSVCVCVCWSFHLNRHANWLKHLKIPQTTHQLQAPNNARPAYVYACVVYVCGVLIEIIETAVQFPPNQIKNAKQNSDRHSPFGGILGGELIGKRARDRKKSVETKTRRLRITLQ